MILFDNFIVFYNFELNYVFVFDLIELFNLLFCNVFLEERCIGLIFFVCIFLIVVKLI